ncbi:hypothetical protein EJ06DRAFT_583072 [Trichodelitschia bisporula]|uniref:Uncharacterized protein n=1 Tax=Trichodelitschia bisporula TaxID=703511 RepID=A0A6G1HTD7_9PEZI|nr:hypothetical protein EJ06DRAFT_583072 [Trichodelitschia bisporula]
MDTSNMAMEDYSGVDDMDIDMDIDMRIDTTYEQPEAQQLGMTYFDNEDTRHDTAEHANLGPQSAPDKVHILGLDNLDTDALQAYVREYTDFERFVTVEWINDTSANLRYDSSDAAFDALVRFTDSSVDPSHLGPQQLRRARPHPSYAEVILYVRQATTADVKQKRAHEASRFYLLHPEKDPHERRRQQPTQRKPASRNESDFSKRRFDDREHSRRRARDTFADTMYDEAMITTEGGSDGSTSDSGRRKRARFGGRRGGRDRSASPMRSRTRSADGRRARQRSPRPFTRLNAGKELFGSGAEAPSTLKANQGKELFAAGHVRALKTALGTNELFPEKTATRAKELFPQTKELFPAEKELFPEKIADSKPKELFPHKTATSNHRRTGAVDATSLNVKGAGENRQSRAQSERLTDRPVLAGSGRSLEERITGRDGAADLHILGAARQPGFSVKGAATRDSDDINIKGSAPAASRELFPEKMGAGFGTKIKGRGAPRRRAEDMFG